MIREEAIKKLKEQQNEFNEHCIDYAGINEAYNMAIKSLEAWEKIRKEIASDGQSDINVKYVLNLIDKHLSEVSE